MNGTKPKNCGMWSLSVLHAAKNGHPSLSRPKKSEICNFPTILKARASKNGGCTSNCTFPQAVLQRNNSQSFQDLWWTGFQGMNFVKTSESDVFRAQNWRSAKNINKITQRQISEAHHWKFTESFAAAYCHITSLVTDGTVTKHRSTGCA